MREDLARFLKEFQGCAVAPTRRLIAAYVRAQLGSLRRKSVKAMAQLEGIPVRTLQELLSLHRWDEDLLRDLLQRRVAREHGAGRLTGVLEMTACPKKGDKTAGVAPQVVAPATRPENSVVVIHLGLEAGEFRCLLDSELYIPRKWFADPARLGAAGIPPERVHRNWAQIALDLLQRADGNGLEFSEFVVGRGFQGDGTLLAALGRRAAFGAQVGPAPGMLARDVAGVGLDQFEVRTYRSIKRHLILSSLSLLFRAERRAGRRVTV